MIIKSDYIRKKLSYIKSVVEDDTKQKLYDINKTAEDIFMHILNDVYGWELDNANNIKANFPAIDLIDTTNKIVIQMTSETSTKKVREDTIEKFQRLVKQDEYNKYANYKIKMFYIKDKPNFQKATLEEFAKKGVPKSHLLGIEDINREVSANPDIAHKVFKTLCKIFHDKICDVNISPQLTTKLGKDTIIGRAKELKVIDTILNSNSLLLINGIGGIGKSNIASYYLHSQKDKLDYYGFFEDIESFTIELREPLDLKYEKEQDAFMEALVKLRQLEGKKLLVFDDVTNIEENRETIERILELRHSGYKILLTSREEIDYIESYYLDILSVDDAKKLFNSIYKVKDELLLEDILEYLDYHAFFVEMTAKTIKYKKSLTLLKIKKMFESGKFYQISIKKGKNFNTYLSELFSFSMLDMEEKAILRKFVILPSIEIDFEFLKKVFRTNYLMSLLDMLFYIKRTFFRNISFDENFEENLNSLIEKGWLIKTNNGYKLHQIVKEYILINYPPNIEEAYNTISSIMNEDDNLHFLLDKKTLKKRFIYIEAIINFQIKTRYVNKNTADYYNVLGDGYFKQGLYRKAKFSYTKAIEIFESLKKEYPEIAISYNGLGEIHNFNREFEKAKELYLKALKIQKRILKKETIDIAKTYINIANYYKSKKEYKLTKVFYLKALEIQKERLGETHPDTIINYMNLANLYQLLKEYNKTEQIYIKILDNGKKISSQKYEYKLMSYTGLASVYLANNDLEKAKKYTIFSLDIIKYISPHHSYIIELEKSLEIIEFKLNTKNVVENQNEKKRYNHQ